MKTIDEERKAIIEGLSNQGLFEMLLDRYWQLAFLEGKDDVSHGDAAQETLNELRELFASQAARNQSNNVPVEPTADYVAYLYRDNNGTLKLAQEMPPPDNAFPVFTTNIRFLDVARLVLDDNVDLILEHGGVKLWEALIKSVNASYTSPQQSNQSNNVPVEPFGWLLIEGVKVHFYFNKHPEATFSEGFIEKYKDNLKAVYTSPQQSNALEMAAKLAEEVRLMPESEWRRKYGAVTAGGAIVQAIKDLINQPESDGK